MPELEVGVTHSIKPLLLFLFAQLWLCQPAHRISFAIKQRVPWFALMGFFQLVKDEQNVDGPRRKDFSGRLICKNSSYVY
jgi:hypothetical protein